MDTYEMKAEISKKIRKGMFIAFIVYETFIFLMGILGFVVDIEKGGGFSQFFHYDYEYFHLNWWFFLSIKDYYNDRTGVFHDRNEFNVGNFFLAIFIILFLMAIPAIVFLIENRRRKLTELAANEKEIAGFYTAFIPVSKIALKMPIGKIDNITVVNSVLYCFTGKKIRISSASGVIRIPYVLNADEIVTFISESIEQARSEQTRRETLNKARIQIDVADHLKKFADLRDAGIITEEEFNQKKSELLGKI